MLQHVAVYCSVLPISSASIEPPNVVCNSAYGHVYIVTPCMAATWLQQEPRNVHNSVYEWGV